ncbi:hypothetical protein JXC34_05875 [Candidatus Woesearchaeota archaeon]|nr:hypothetical protein [Candidatus Woesearchaeota archaeon]
MALIGFHFKKMQAEKKKALTSKVNVNSNITVVNAKEAKVNMGKSKQAGIEFTFNFTTKYVPDVATIDLEGAVVYLGPEDKVKETLSGWTKDKKIPQDVLEEVYNYLLARCNIQALVLGRDMQLPPHVPMPKVGKGN